VSDVGAARDEALLSCQLERRRLSLAWRGAERQQQEPAKQRHAGGPASAPHMVEMVLSITCADWITEMMLSDCSAPLRPIWAQT
jgi:hypothetical protein